MLSQQFAPSQLSSPPVFAEWTLRSLYKFDILRLRQLLSENTAKKNESQGGLSKTELAAVLSAIGNGDNQEFSRLFEAYYSTVTRVVRSIVPQAAVEEAVHESFIRIFKSLPKYREDGKFEAWIKQLAARSSYDYWRRTRARREVSSSPEMLSSLLEQIDTSENEQLSSDLSLKAQLLRSLDEMTLEDRTVLILRYLEEWSVKEVAAVLQWSQPKTKVRAMRARQKLRSIMLRRVKEDDLGNY